MTTKTLALWLGVAMLSGVGIANAAPVVVPPDTENMTACGRSWANVKEPGKDCSNTVNPVTLWTHRTNR